MSDEKCGCGRDVRYVRISKNGEQAGSCNKYCRCPTYEELNEIVDKQNSLLRAYRMKREVDGMNGRNFDKPKHFYAEGLIESLEEKI